ncbi:hypothetical protein B9Z55_009771 [Caenorhabditis nigoni]|uniref:Uncharacterized protein n=1 Tax=Caenorhabditis nigoni TaxID=1611254 RepID=A0A2G5UTH3_9PELO|nr:hypothetical protein B9Z55_009771 [Caenorhabditis nigoni]
MAEMKNCKYQDGFCEIKKNEIITWDVNREQKCQYISIAILDGMYSNKLWVNNKNQIALNFQSDKTIQDCNSSLMISDEGFAVRRINRAAAQYSPRQIPVSIPSHSQRQQLEEDRRKREQEEQRKQQEDNRRREQEDSRKREEQCPCPSLFIFSSFFYPRFFKRNKYNTIQRRDQEDARRRDQERQKQNEADFEKTKQEKLKFSLCLYVIPVSLFSAYFL